MVGIARLLPKNYLFTILGIAVGVAGLVALGAMAERITRFIDGGDRFVLGQISVAGEGMGMGTGFTAGGLLRAAKIEQIAQVPGVAAVQAQVMLPLNPTTSQFLTLTQELVLGIDPATPMPNRQFRELPVKSGRFLRANDRGVAVVGADFAATRKLARGRPARAGRRTYLRGGRGARQDAHRPGPLRDDPARRCARSLAASRPAPGPGLRGRRRHGPPRSQHRGRGGVGPGWTPTPRAPHPGMGAGSQRHDSRAS